MPEKISILYAGEPVVDCNASISLDDLKKGGISGEGEFQCPEKGVAIELYYKGKVFKTICLEGKFSHGKNIISSERISSRPINLQNKINAEVKKIRPGGGAVNNLFASWYFLNGNEKNFELCLLGLKENKFLRNRIEEETRNVYFRSLCLKLALTNINLSYGDKITFTNDEGRAFEQGMGKEKCQELEDIILETEPDIFVVNSIKDQDYLDGLYKIWKLREKDGKKNILAATSSMIKKNKEKTLAMAKECDIFVSNSEELLQLFGVTKKEEDIKREELERFVKTLYNVRKWYRKEECIEGKQGRIYVTFGKNGAMASDEEGGIYYQEARDGIRPIDPNGAGDVFTGVMTAMEASCENIKKILSYANAAAQMSVQYAGANPSPEYRELLPTVENIEKFIEENKKEVSRIE